MHDDNTMFLFTFADEDAAGPGDVEGQKALLRKRFEASGWECPQILNALDAADDFYFDRVSQIRMDPEQGLWTRGRVTLIGDAASCVSFLAGQGTALAMVAAYILAGELHRCKGDYAEAFRRYQDLFGPFVLAKQKAALRFAGAFAPKSKLTLFLRNQLFKLMAIRWIGDLAVGRDLADNPIAPSLLINGRALKPVFLQNPQLNPQNDMCYTTSASYGSPRGCVTAVARFEGRCECENWRQRGQTGATRVGFIGGDDDLTSHETFAFSMRIEFSVPQDRPE